MHLPDPLHLHPQPGSGNIDALVHAVQRFASSYGLQPFKVIAVKDASVIHAIQAVAAGPLVPNHPACLLAFAIRSAISKSQIDDYLTGIISRKNASAGSLNSYNKYLTGTINNRDHEGRNWAAKQVSLALGHLTTTAAALKVPVTILQVSNVADVDRILGLKEKELHTAAAVTLGDAADYTTTTLPKHATSRQAAV